MTPWQAQAMAPVVYVVDDDTLVTDSLSRALALETDWTVLPFNDGAHALASMPARAPDAVLSRLQDARHGWARLSGARAGRSTRTRCSCS